MREVAEPAHRLDLLPDAHPGDPAHLDQLAVPFVQDHHRVLARVPGVPPECGRHPQVPVVLAERPSVPHRPGHLTGRDVLRGGAVDRERVHLGGRWRRKLADLAAVLEHRDAPPAAGGGDVQPVGRRVHQLTAGRHCGGVVLGGGFGVEREHADRAETGGPARVPDVGAVDQPAVRGPVVDAGQPVVDGGLTDDLLVLASSLLRRPVAGRVDESEAWRTGREHGADGPVVLTCGHQVPVDAVLLHDVGVARVGDVEGDDPGGAVAAVGPVERDVYGDRPTAVPVAVATQRHHLVVDQQQLRLRHPAGQVGA